MSLHESSSGSDASGIPDLPNNHNHNFKQQLKTIVSNAITINDTLSAIQCVPIDTVKQFLNDTIDELDDDKARKTFYLVSSLDDIFSDDINQYILSFAGIYIVIRPQHNMWRYVVQCVYDNHDKYMRT